MRPITCTVLSSLRNAVPLDSQYLQLQLGPDDVLNCDPWPLTCVFADTAREAIPVVEYWSVVGNAKWL